MNKKKTQKNSNRQINWKNLFATEKGRALLFFGFYAIFFFVVIILIRTSHNNMPKKEKEYKIEVSYDYKLDQLESKNYHYKYLATIGNNVVLYEGNCKNSKELFSVFTNGITTNYYRDGDLFIKQELNSWSVADNPYALAEFYEVEMLSKILEASKFISKTDFQAGNHELKFSIATGKLLKILTNQTVNIPDDSNEIILKTDDNKNVYALEYNLTNYYSYCQQMPVNATLEFSYSEFGKIKEIEKP